MIYVVISETSAGKGIFIVPCVGNRINIFIGKDVFEKWFREEARKCTGKISIEGSKHLISNSFEEQFFIYTNLFLTNKIYYHSIGKFLNNIVLLFDLVTIT